MDELNHILFERFVSGDLTESEKKNFEDRLSNDQEFKKEFEVFQAMDLFVHKKLRQSNPVSNFEKEQTRFITEENSQENSNNKRNWSLKLFFKRISAFFKNLLFST